MCGLSGTEFIVLLLVAIIVLGPEKLPDLLKWAGRTMKEVRRLTGDLGQVSREIQQTTDVDAIRKQIRDELQLERVRQVRRDAETEIDALRARVKSSDGGSRRDRVRRAAGGHVADEAEAGTTDPVSAEAVSAEAVPSGVGPSGVGPSGVGPSGVGPSGEGAALGEIEVQTAAEAPLPAVRPAVGAMARRDLGGSPHEAAASPAQDAPTAAAREEDA